METLVRITSVDSQYEDMDLARPYSIAFRTVTQVSNIISTWTAASTSRATSCQADSRCAKAL